VPYREREREKEREREGEREILIRKKYHEGSNVKER